MALFTIEVIEHLHSYGSVQIEADTEEEAKFLLYEHYNEISFGSPYSDDTLEIESIKEVSE